jgi:hypothetical protein
LVTFADYSASDYDIRITQGDTFIEEMLFEDGEGEAIDLTGYSFQSQLRRTADNGLVADFGIVIEDNEFIRRTLEPAVTSGLSGTYVHDLQWTTPEGQIKTLVTGEFEIEPEVTR